MFFVELWQYVLGATIYWKELHSQFAL